MAQIKNTFVKSKMNRDLDARLMPNGEYREGRNINISKSEGADVGALENVKGNISVFPGFINKLNAGISENEKPLEIIGMFTHEDSSSVYMFLTTFSDASKDQLENHAHTFQSHCYITRIKYNGNLEIPEQNRYETSILVEGSFLNFSKTHPILGFNIVEDLMFWTDNRNQPRKINIVKAASRPYGEAFYSNEDQISVAKYYPHNPIALTKKTGNNWESTVKSTTTEWLPVSLSAPLSSIGSVSGKNVLQFLSSAGNPPTAKPKWSGTTSTTPPSAIDNYFDKIGVVDYPVVKVTNASNSGSISYYMHESLNNQVSFSETSSSTTTQVSVPAGWASPGDVIVFQLKNPEYEASFDGDREFLKDKFPRFSYRFKYTDGEYSLMAPFTQPVFLPAQLGSFTWGDEDRASTSTELSFFENRASEIGLVVDLPYFAGNNPSVSDFYRNQLQTLLHVTEIDILFKSSKDNNVYVLDNVDVEQGCPDEFLVNPLATSTTGRNQFIYTYRGKKPFKVLPESDTTRVNDIIPVRAQSQETSGNRIMYGNYLNNHALPPKLSYEVNSSVKNGSFSPEFDISANPPIATTINNKIKEYYNATLKQGRTYQVGVVLSDRFGRQSTVMLAKESSLYGNVANDKSTVTAPYDNSGLASVLNFFGNSLKIAFYEPIPDLSSYNVENYPGLYSRLNNPRGWYSYKIVVKQQEQEYYNVFLPGSCSGNIIYKDNQTKLNYGDSWNVSNLSLFGDNINKIPRDMTNVGPTDRIYGSKESLYFRVVQPNYTYTGNAQDASTVDINRWNSRQTQLPVLESTVVSIQPFLDLGTWTTQKGVAGSISYPGGIENPAGTFIPGTINPFVKSDNNPFIANVNNNNNKDRVGFFNTMQSTTYVNPDLFLGKFSNSLIVAETKAVESDLDLYWETTTSGLISDLNNGVFSSASQTAPRDLTTFIFTGVEGVHYDGTTLSKCLLNRDISVVTNSGSVTTSNDYTITLNSATGIDSGGNELILTDYFLMVSNQAAPKTYNIHLKQDTATNSGLYFDKASDPNWGNMEIVFNFTIQIGTIGQSNYELPTTVSKRNNFFSNTAPTMGTTTNPSPVDPADSNWVGDTWAFSIGGEEPDYNQTNFNYIKNHHLFTKTSENDIGALWNGQTSYQIDSDSRFNVRDRNQKFFIQYGYTPLASAPKPTFLPNKPNWNNGSFFGNTEGCELYIEKLETAVYKGNGDVKYDFEEWFLDPTTYSNPNLGQNPVKIDFSTYPASAGYGTQGERYTYREYPWKVEFVDSNDSYWNQSSTLSFPSGYYLFANPDCPPFEYHGAALKKSGINARFWAEGYLDGGRYSVHKITIGVKETFQGGLTSSPNSFVVYTKLYR